MEYVSTLSMPIPVADEDTDLTQESVVPSLDDYGPFNVSIVFLSDDCY